MTHNCVFVMALILDTETNGLPDTRGLKWGYYPNYRDLDKYNNSRIVQFTIMVCDEKFTEVLLQDTIVKRDGFDIYNQQFHGITNDISDNDGVSFIDIMEEFYQSLKSVNYIFAHNIAFDINVIKSELFRYGLFHIITELEKKELVCTMKHTKPILKILNRYGNYKNPSLNELYKFYFGKNIENAHNSKYDVINLHTVIKHMYEINVLNFTF